ncbi:MAG: sigma-70 family RNA polymerase sigma factor [Deltaproteobacteria bacterium]|nr:sigma-70 family RNA polymerase sigma factor [Deltaproteobacteria bacterium]
MTLLDPPASALLHSASDGDLQARAGLVRQFAPLVLSWCAHLANGAIDEEDAAHDVLVIVLDHLGDVRDPEAFPAWLWRVTSREVFRQVRLARLRAWLPFFTSWTGAPDPLARDRVDDVEDDDLVRRVRAAIGSLPPRQREVLVLCGLCRYTDDEAAFLLQLPLGTVKSRLRRARGRFRREATARGLDPVREGAK